MKAGIAKSMIAAIGIEYIYIRRYGVRVFRLNRLGRTHLNLNVGLGGKSIEWATAAKLVTDFELYGISLGLGWHAELTCKVKTPFLLM